MSVSRLLQQIGQKASDKEGIARKVIRKPELLSDLFRGLRADKAGVKYGCSKILRIISEKSPDVLYAQLDFFITLLDSDNTFHKWDAILIIGNLAAVDSKKRIDRILDSYLRPIRGPVMITAANVMRGAAKIALAKPGLAERISKELLKVGKGRYQTAECRNVALGHAIESFARFFDQIEDKAPVIRLIRRQLKNPRSATRKKAERFLKRHAV